MLKTTHHILISKVHDGNHGDQIVLEKAYSGGFVVLAKENLMHIFPFINKPRWVEPQTSACIQ